MESVVRADPFEPAFWAGRRVLLTGHTGFKGAWLSLWLSSLGAKVSGLADGVPTKRSLFVDAGIADLVEDWRGDICNREAVRDAIASSNAEIVLHLAAQPLVRLSYAEPVRTYATNVMGTAHVLEEARLYGSGCPVLVVTTDKCYENREWDWGYRETEPMGGHDPYSSSKGCAELVASAYHRSFSDSTEGFRVATARAGNVIGGGDWAEDRLLPDLVRGFFGETTTPIRNPSAIRPWQHVLEPLGGYLMLGRGLLEREHVDGQGWNFGPAPDAEVSVGQVADSVCRILGRPDGWRAASNRVEPHEAQLLRLDITKARVRLGWRPRWTLEQALAASIAIYRTPAKGKELRALMLDQVAAYSSASRQRHV